ncbi:MAG: AbrB/MazE/SpoVT family DNA-binding domain-containing protein [Candidatus Berkelbacteria bacterium]|nr:AbrB/MazE/SpoVT family DNA-binding domain-containing protein [Candidatus Berkelbacteria bacterium]
MESESRKLIKFSNYSLCVTLPKSVIRELKWNKGDIVTMVVNKKSGEILIKKPSGAKKITEKSPVEKVSQGKTSKKSRW